MFFSFFHALGYMLLAQCLVFVSITFANGKLMPSLLGNIYQYLPSIGSRVAVCLFTTYALANYFIPKGYAVSNASIGGAAFMIASCLVMVTTAILVDNSRINIHIVLGCILMSAGAAYVVYGLHGGQS
jgi:hypothetical protein